MVRTRKTQIVNKESIFSDEEILQSRFTEAFVACIFESDDQGNVFLLNPKEQKNAQICESCDDNPNFTCVKDALSLYGYRRRCKRPCTNGLSIRSGFFESSKFKFKEIFLICMKYMKSDSFDDIS
jgi:hypothetical protein